MVITYGTRFDETKYRNAGAQANVITDWQNYPTPDNYEQFQTSGPNILRAVNTQGSGICHSNKFPVSVGQEVPLTVYLTNTSGSIPKFLMVNEGWSKASEVTLKEGRNDVVFVSTWDGKASLRLYSVSGANADFSLSFNAPKINTSISMLKKYWWIAAILFVGVFLAYKKLKKEKG